MTDRRSSQSGKKPKVEKLELNKETVQDLTEGEAAATEGGEAPGGGVEFSGRKTWCAICRQSLRAEYSRPGGTCASFPIPCGSRRRCGGC
jgi:hypothetical protein